MTTQSLETRVSTLERDHQHLVKQADLEAVRGDLREMKGELRVLKWGMGMLCLLNVGVIGALLQLLAR